MKKLLLSIVTFMSLTSSYATLVPKQVTVEVCGNKIVETTVPNGPGGVTTTTIKCGTNQALVCFSYTKTVWVEQYTVPDQPGPFDPVENGVYLELYSLGNLIASGTVSSSIVNIFYPNPGEISYIYVLNP